MRFITKKARRLVLSLDDPVRGSVELLVAVEEGETDDEEVLEGLAAGLLDKLAGTGSRTTSGDEVAGTSVSHTFAISHSLPAQLTQQQ